MLVIFGANGRTGIEVVREAMRRGIPLRCIARNDRDVDQLNRTVPITDVSFANADHASSLGPVLEGATSVISCIDPRTAGPNSQQYGRRASANIVEAATKSGAEAILHVTVMGAFRWSRAKLNRASFHLDENVRRCDGPWALLRISCYIDEIIEAHVWPPDGGRPYEFLSSSRYAPISRAEAGKAILDHLSVMTPGRAPCIGGAATYSGEALNLLVAPCLRDTR
ncbi:MAG: NAD(P)H-binding protein, partial [Myxococcota bacterium]|nr:NAD(P)H-binding protein [Myxococcota bacterium]